MCQPGTYHDGRSNRCMKCSQNTYQDQAGQTSCKNCPGTLNKYIPSTGSRSKNDCVCECYNQSLVSNHFLFLCLFFDFFSFLVISPHGLWYMCNICFMLYNSTKIGIMIEFWFLYHHFWFL